METLPGWDLDLCFNFFYSHSRTYKSTWNNSALHVLCCPDSILHQLFIVRFLGSMEVKTAESADVISETMRQILAARAIHNIFRMTESHLLVTCDCLKYEPLCLLVYFGWVCIFGLQQQTFCTATTCLTDYVLYVCRIFLVRLIDPQTQVTRLRVRTQLLICSDSFKSQTCVVFSSCPSSCSLLLSSHSSRSLLWSSVHLTRTTRGSLALFCRRQRAGATAELCATSLSPTTMERRSLSWLSVGRLSFLSLCSVCLSCFSSSCVSDLWQYRSGQANSLPLWDGETGFKPYCVWDS